MKAEGLYQGIWGLNCGEDTDGVEDQVGGSQGELKLRCTKKSYGNLILCKLILKYN